jgi:MFS-type transporter involved in bile tolerance (Atg22 family)
MNEPGSPYDPDRPRAGRSPNRGPSSWFGPKAFGWGQRPVTWQGYLVAGAAVLIAVGLTTLARSAGWNPALIAIIPLTLVVAVRILTRR